MPKSEDNPLTSIASGIAQLPAPAKTTFIAAASRILGGLAALPAAGLRRLVQAIEDKTDARTIVSQGLAQALVEQSKGDDTIMKAVAEAYLPDVLRKTINKARTIKIAAEEYAKHGGSDKSTGPDDDWMNQFIRFSEDASSERLQLLFGKILAGEIVNPGTFSPATLRTVGELTQSLAQDFQWIWERRIDTEIWKGPEFNRGEAWRNLTRLRDAGLMSPIDAGIHQPTFSPMAAFNGLSLWRLGAADSSSLTIAMDADARSWLPVVNFTAVGLELGSLLPVPDYEAALKAVALGFPKQHVAWIKFSRDAKLGETIWEAN